MKKIIYLIFISFIVFNVSVLAQSDELVNVCALDIGDATYLKDFKIKLQQGDIKPKKSLDLIETRSISSNIRCSQATGHTRR